MGGPPEIPQRNLSEELGALLQYAPKFTRSSYRLASEFAPKVMKQDIRQLTEFAPKYAGLGYNIARQFAPQYQALNLGQMQRNIAGQPLLAELNRQAQSELAAGGQLTPEQERDVTQRTRAGFAARGNVLGNQALGTELLERDVYARQRAGERRGFASGVQALNLQQLAGMGGVAQMPNLAAYGAPGAAFGPLGSALGSVQGSVNPLVSYGSDLFSSNQNAAATQNIAASNKGGALTGAGIGAIGSLAGGAIAL